MLFLYFFLWCIILGAIRESKKEKIFKIAFNLIEEHIKSLNVELSDNEKNQIEKETKRQLHNTLILNVLSSVIVFICIFIIYVMHDMPVRLSFFISISISTALYLFLVFRKNELYLKKLIATVCDKSFVCPHCNNKLSYFIEKEFDTNQKQIVLNKINYMYYKKHVIHYCKNCHRNDEKIYEQRDKL